MEQRPITSNESEIEKTKKSVINSGKYLRYFGYFTIIASLILNSLSYFEISNVLDGFMSVFGMVFSILMGILLIVFGGRIEQTDTDLKKNMYSIGILSIIFSLITILLGGSLSYILLAFIFESYTTITKAYKNNDFIKTLNKSEYKIGTGGRILFGLLSLVLLGGSFLLDSLSTYELDTNKIAQEFQGSIELPFEMDDDLILESIESTSSDTITWSFKVTDSLRDDGIEEFLDDMKNGHVEMLCNIALKLYMSSGLQVKFDYHNKTSGDDSSYVINNDNC